MADCQSSTLYYAPTEAGCSVPVVNSSGTIADIPFVAAHDDTGLSYDVSGLPAGSIYDVWVTAVSGFAVMGFLRWGPVYGSGSYGSHSYSAGPAVSDTRYFGVPVNSAGMSLRLSGGTALSVDQYRGSYLGSIRISDDAGIIKCQTSYDVTREWGVWNAHNQERIVLKGGSIPYVTGPEYAGQNVRGNQDWGPWIGSLSGFLKVFSGRPVAVSTRFNAGSWNEVFAGANASIIQAAIGWDSDSIPSGMWSPHSFETGNASFAGAGAMVSEFHQPSSCGLRKVYPLVKIQGVSLANPGNSQISFWGQECRGILSAEWMG